MNEIFTYFLMQIKHIQINPFWKNRISIISFISFHSFSLLFEIIIILFSKSCIISLSFLYFIIKSFVLWLITNYSCLYFITLYLIIKNKSHIQSNFYFEPLNYLILSSSVVENRISLFPFLLQIKADKTKLVFSSLFCSLMFFFQWISLRLFRIITHLVLQWRNQIEFQSEIRVL